VLFELGLWGTILLFVVINGNYLLKNNYGAKLKSMLLSDPYSLTPHFELLSSYQRQGNTASFEHEADLITWLIQYNAEKAHVLGSSTKAYKRLVSVQNESELRKEKVAFWEDFVKKHPDYRDGYLILVSLYLRDGNNKKAKDSFEMAKYLDPNNEFVKQAEEFFPEE